MNDTVALDYEPNRGWFVSCIRHGVVAEDLDNDEFAHTAAMQHIAGYHFATTGRTPEIWPAIMPGNKFHQGSWADGKHYWLTPPDLYARLDAEFHFDFDPCPYPLPDGFDGLTVEWGQSNYVNPPFGSVMHEGRRKGPTAWVRKAIKEYRKGKLVVLVYPVDKWVLMLLDALGTDVRNLGDIRWCSTEDGQPGPGTGRHIACFVLRPKEAA